MRNLRQRLRLIITVSALLLSPSLLASPYFDGQWDLTFRKAVKTYLPFGTDWLLLKSQCYQESHLNPHAVSPVGAFGLCQFMPGTARDVGRVLGYDQADFWHPDASIMAAGYYMGRLHKTWSAERPAMDRYMIVLASYNAGAGHLIKAQGLCGGHNLYRQIIPCLPQVTGHHAKETQGYVENIVGKWWPMMLFR